MKITIIGCGYVGLPSGVGFAELGNEIICVDLNAQKIKDLKDGCLTLFEENLPELFKRNVEAGRLKFTTSMADAVPSADLVIIAVGTPPHPETHEADLQYIYAAAEELAQYLQGYTVVATKSTVPVKTGDAIEKLMREKNPTANFDVISLPEFLREGKAITDFFHPDRIVIGTDSLKARQVIKDLYANFPGQPHLIFCKRTSAELIKYASNGFLSVKIHYINELANFCEKTGADISEVALGMGADSRIGSAFLRPGPGFGGSCFPKDTMALDYMARKNGVALSLIAATIKGNQQRKVEMAQRIMQAVQGIEKPKIAVWGLAFKNGTDDCRESPAIEILTYLINIQLNICVYDPQATYSAKQLLGDKVTYATDPIFAAQDADVLAILTEWPSFKDVDLLQLRTAMRGRLIMDFRNLLNAKQVLSAGFSYQYIGSSFRLASHKENSLHRVNLSQSGP